MKTRTLLLVLLFSPAAPGKPTVIEIPGGPGDGYIGEAEGAARSALIPPEYGVIAIDPRGVGVNDFGPDQRGGQYSSDRQVEDLIAIIRAENLSNYAVHGQSYGTLVATKLGSRISHMPNIEKPNALVLTGVVNEVFEDQMKEYNNQMRRMTGDLSPLEKERLKDNLRDLLKGPFKGDNIVFSQALFNMMVFNIESESSGFTTHQNLFKFFKMLSSENVDANDPLFQQLKSFGEMFAGKTPPFSAHERKNTMAEQVKCTEMSKAGFDSGVFFETSTLQFKLTNLDCVDKGYRISNPFHSADHQIEGIPVFYFQGAIDPATPDSEARKHYGSQRNTEKVYVSLKNHAHTVMLALYGCKEGLWDSINAGPRALVKRLGSCQSPDVKVQGSKLNATPASRVQDRQEMNMKR